MSFFRKVPVKSAAAAVLILALPFTAREEGTKLKAYLDPIGIPTICMGETENVKMGDVKTKQECDKLFEARLGAFSYAVDMAISTPLSAPTHAAFTSWAYNVGIGAMSRSTLVKKANAGDLVGACNELLKWKMAGDKPILLPRRERERALCLSGL